MCLRLAAASTFMDLWNELMLRDDYHVSKIGRAVKSKRVGILVRKFMTAMQSVVTKEASNFYMHVITHHLCDMIRACPVHLMDVSGNGIEQLNQLVKGLFK